MATVILNGSARVHPSEVVEAYGETESGRSVSVYFSGDLIKGIAKYLEHTDHLGHAFWHYKNPDRPYPCETCKSNSKPKEI